MINNKSIRSSLLYLLSLLLLPILFIIFYSAHQQKNAAFKNASGNALRIARNLAEQQIFVENNTRQFLSVLSKLPEISKKDTDILDPLFESFLSQNKSYASLLLVDLDGNLIASAKGYQKLNVKDRKYFKEIIRSKSFSAGEFAYGRLTGKPVLHYAAPVFDKLNVLQSILIVSFDLKYFDQIYQNANLGEGSVFAFLDYKGVVLFHSSNAVCSVGHTDCSAIMQNLNNKSNSVTFIAEGGDKISRFYGFQKLELSTSSLPYLYIYVGIPETVAYADYRQTMLMNCIVWFLSILFVFSIWYLFSKRFILNPIDRLVKTAGEIAEGNLSIRSGIGDSKSELGMLATAIDDMTERLLFREVEQKAFTKEIRKLKERFELASNAAHIGIWDWHITKNTLIWDRNMFELYGIEPLEFKGQLSDWEDCVYREDIDFFKAEIRGAIEHHKSYRSEFRIHHPIYGIKYIRIFANVIYDKLGAPVRLIGVNWDLSERKLMEERLEEAKAKAEANDKLKSSFLASVSHELRTPLHAMIGFSQILKNNDFSCDERIQYLDIIENSGNRLLHVISDIMDISLLESGELKLNESKCDIRYLITDIFQKYENRRLLEKKTFEFNLKLNIKDDVMLHIDSNRFKQVLVVLLDNAFRNTFFGEVILSCNIKMNELVCCVKDTGTSIFPDSEEHIFDRFQKVSFESTESGESGLGLAICKGLVDLMKGRIWYVKQNIGTEFYFSFPLCRERKLDNSLSDVQLLAN